MSSFFFLLDLYGFLDRTAEVTESGIRDHTQQGATGLTRTLGGCSEDRASVYGSPALPTELTGTRTSSHGNLLVRLGSSSVQNWQFGLKKWPTDWHVSGTAKKLRCTITPSSLSGSLYKRKNQTWRRAKDCRGANKVCTIKTSFYLLFILWDFHPPPPRYLWMLDRKHTSNTCCSFSKCDKHNLRDKSLGLHQSGNEIGGSTMRWGGEDKNAEDKAVTASVGEKKKKKKRVGEKDREKRWGWFVSESLTGMKGSKARWGRSDLGLSVWPSVYLRFSWRYKLVVCRVREKGKREMESGRAVGLL